MSTDTYDIQNEAVNVSARLDLKTNQYVKTQLEEAAALTGVNLTAFVLSAAAEKAREIMCFNAHTRLSPSAWNNLNEVLSNPPKEPTAAAKELVANRRIKNGAIRR
ncbi:TPA: DUF1778 domain-containing protein [Vibrio parahaemolyticus]|uniref:type II toxin-antitoxin system TacA family antitoxin n=1 Tax=Vibrio harveyi group TaxID=717610 RepID=UPI00030E06C4|nr:MULTISPECIES: DUF1778 domain-containing protein [Vibrio harveyi group]ELB7596516.1 DUF1778 domain-containing protein [Vibrio parahaemolyticus]MBE4376702.1 DUF1778 domain-containing protein [Vibrio parahaemolyticus]MCQ9244247.1 DUF1778 domain-containing protein [Vibrio diabolicus]MCR9308992.1 DUF1778 domain-containing protein [Vibrio diabolicus]MCR9578990.1 DUF1778 domain-containing protein [Vibrio antiquarius]